MNSGDFNNSRWFLEVRYYPVEFDVELHTDPGIFHQIEDKCEIIQDRKISYMDVLDRANLQKLLLEILEIKEKSALIAK